MDNSIIVALISALIGGVLGGVIESLLNYRKEFSTAIWEKRLNSYKKLWAITGRLSQYPVDDQFSYKNLHQMNIDFKNWYFEDGGILLTKEAREVYEKVKITMSKLTKHKEKDKTPLGEDYEIIRKKCSQLRSALTDDLLSRNKQRLFR